jgi:YD repeat-containing protein
MKKLTFIIAACMFSILTYAGNNVPIKRTLSPNIEPQIKLTVQSNKPSKLNPKDEALKLLEQSKKAAADGNVPNFIGAEQLMKINAEKKERLDSIVGKIDEGENNVSLQSFTYDTYSHPVSSLNYTWNGAKNIWEFYSQNTYLWDEKGNCFEYLEQFYDSTGTKYIRSYNDDGTIKNIYSYTADQTGTWTGSQAVEYEYDNAGNILTETHSWYDTSVPAWSPSLKVEATYDELNRQTSGAQYNWNGGKRILDKSYSNQV